MRDLWVKRVWRVAVEMNTGDGVVMVDWGFSCWRKNGIGWTCSRMDLEEKMVGRLYKWLF